VLVTTKQLAMRAMRADLVYTVQRMRAIAERKGNPFGVAIKAFGQRRHWPSLDYHRPASIESSD
jgi:hypothetical protein